MGYYINSNLIKDEKVLYEGKVSLWSLWRRVLLGSVFFLFIAAGLIWQGIVGCVLIGSAIWSTVAIRYYTTELAITNKRVIAKFGLIRRSTIEMSIPKVESIQVEQSILGRIFDFGSIIISGAGEPKAPIPGISQPLTFRRTFLEIQEDGESTPQDATLEMA